MDKSIVFFDIDGTLIGFDGKSTVMPESTKLALKKLRENGHLAFICSGRPIRFILQEFDCDMFDGVIAGNGNYIVFEDKCIYNRLIDKPTLERLMTSFDKLQVSCNFSGAYNGYAYKMDRQRINKYNSQFKGESFLIEEWEVDDVKANMMDIFFESEEQIQTCIDYFSDSLIFNLHGPHMSADISFKSWSKAEGIKYFMEHAGFSMENTFAFGDGSNDMGMFNIVNTGIAMGNAIPELKAQADYVTSDIFEDGIYNAMKYFNLI